MSVDPFTFNARFPYGFRRAALREPHVGFATHEVRLGFGPEAPDDGLVRPWFRSSTRNTRTMFTAEGCEVEWRAA